MLLLGMLVCCCKGTDETSNLMVHMRAIMSISPASSAQSRAASVHAVQAQEKVIKLHAQTISSEAFKPFGQVISATSDGKGFDQNDAQLQLDQGQPRFYIMRIPRRGLQFDRITFHSKVTQCLGGLSTDSWYLAVAAPTGSVQKYPKEEQLEAFRIPHGTFVKLHAGTWHAGPLFQDAQEMDFYNLELSDTNVVDHNTHVYSKTDGVKFELLDP